MKIFAGIIDNKLNVGPLTDPAELEDSRVDLVAVLVGYKTVQYGCEVGEKRIRLDQRTGAKMWCSGLYSIASHHSQVQTNLTSDTETPDINTIKWLEKIKKLAEHSAHPPPPQKMKMKTPRNPVINF